MNIKRKRSVEESPPKGVIFDIKRYAIHDGPGIRTTVFFKGCSLRCAWCHNPESIGQEKELFYRENRCLQCGACVTSCHSGAVSKTQGAVLFQREKCQLCGRCAQVCHSGAREVAGREVTAEELMDEIEKDRIFFDQSGGGITVSGGEPLVQADFLCRLLRLCREREIHTALDTSFHAEKSVVQRVQPLVDLFLCDLKLIDDQEHRKFTGVSNARILENLKDLSEAGAEIIIRIPVLPGVNDGHENLEQTGRFVRSLQSVKQIDILPYNRGGKEKRTRLAWEGTSPEFETPAQEQMEAIAARLQDFGLIVTITGERSEREN